MSRERSPDGESGRIEPVPGVTRGSHFVLGAVVGFVVAFRWAVLEPDWRPVDWLFSGLLWALLGGGLVAVLSRGRGHEPERLRLWLVGLAIALVVFLAIAWLFNWPPLA